MVRPSEWMLSIMGQCLNQLAEGVVVTDAQRRLLWCNRSFREMCGYTLAELRGRNPGGLLQGPGSDRAVILRMREDLDAGRVCQCTILNYRKDGTPYWVSLQIIPIRMPAGHLTYFAALVRRMAGEPEKAMAPFSPDPQAV